MLHGLHCSWWFYRRSHEEDVGMSCFHFIIQPAPRLNIKSEFNFHSTYYIQTTKWLYYSQAYSTVFLEDTIWRSDPSSNVNTNLQCAYVGITAMVTLANIPGFVLFWRSWVGSSPQSFYNQMKLFEDGFTYLLCDWQGGRLSELSQHISPTPLALPPAKTNTKNSICPPIWQTSTVAVAQITFRCFVKHSGSRDRVFRTSCFQKPHHNTPCIFLNSHRRWE